MRSPGQGIKSVRERQGFSLVELLVIMAIIGLLVGLSLPAVSQIMRSSSLGVSGRMLTDQLNLARQVARARSLPVEVRLYKLPDHGSDPASPVSGAGGIYRALQLFLIKEDGSAEAVGRPEFFPSPVMISSGAAESALFSDKSDTTSAHFERSPAADCPGVGAYGKNYRYMPLLFLPGGETDLSQGKNFLTLVLRGDKALAEGANFYTVQVDPIGGNARSFRP